MFARDVKTYSKTYKGLMQDKSFALCMANTIVTYDYHI